MSDKTNVETLDRTYRAFACWAARRAWQFAGCCPCDKVVLAVERYLQGEADFSEVGAARKATAGGVAGAGQIGVPRAMPSAAAQITAWHTGDDSAEMAARRVIHHAALTAGFHALEQAADNVALDSGESASSSRNYYVWRREPQIHVAAESIERAFLEGELRRWITEAVEGRADDKA